MNYRDYYSEIGKLAYAIAKSDGVISKEERDSILKVVNEELAPIEDSLDEFGTEAAYIVQFEFDIMEDQSIPVEDAFNSFIDFFELNSDKFTQRLRKISWVVAERIANSNNGVNKKERKYLEKLENILFVK